MRPRTNPKVVYTGWCPHHGKLTYPSRKAARRSGGGHLPGVSAYRCDEIPGHWHLGHLPGAVRRGDAGRDIYTQNGDT